MVKALVFHAKLSPPTPALLADISERLGHGLVDCGIEVSGCYCLRNLPQDFSPLKQLPAADEAARDLLLLLHPEEPGVRAALITRFLANAFPDDVLTIIVVDEHQDREQDAYVQEVREIYPG